MELMYCIQSQYIQKSGIIIMVGMDLIGQLKNRRWSINYILTMTDYFSKYVEVIALPKKQAPTMAGGIVQVYCRPGALVRMISDQGREFLNEIKAASSMITN